MEKISLIKKDLQEKSGKEWLGVPKQTENKLESLVWYLDSPKLQEIPKLVEEIIEVYYEAKKTNFIKMEGIARKLDQLSIKFSKEDGIKKPSIAQSHSARGEPVIYAKAIEEFKMQVDDFLSSTSGMSLPEKTKKSLITFLGFLNHPKLVKKTALYDEMREKYDMAKEQDFLSMSAFDGLLNKCEIKLGASTDELKTWKSPEERKKELEDAWEKFETEKVLFQEKRENLKSEFEILKVKREKMETERSQMDKEQENLKIKREAMKVEQEKMETEKNQVEKERGILKDAQEKFEVENENLNQRHTRLESEQEAIRGEREKIETEKSQIENEREAMKVEREKIETEKSQIEKERETMKVEREKVETEKNRTENEREAMKVEREKIETEKSQIEKEGEILKNAQEKLEVENENLNQERARVESDQEKLKIKQEKLDLEIEKFEGGRWVSSL